MSYSQGRTRPRYTVKGGPNVKVDQQSTKPVRCLFFPRKNLPTPPEKTYQEDAQRWSPKIGENTKNMGKSHREKY